VHLGLLPASTDPVTALVAEARPVELPRWVRPALTSVAVGLLVVVLVPPLATEARRYEFVEALRFSVLAIAAPALLALGAPWHALRLGWLADRLAASRRRHLDLSRSVGVLLLEMGLVVAARTPVVVDALARYPWLVLAEAVLLVSGGVALWLELVESPPLVPRTARPKRIALAAITMWTVWVTGYIVGLAHASMYGGYHHGAGGLSVAGDQEIVTFVLWFVAAAAFVPVVFFNLVTWLRAEEDPDEGLHRLVQENRRRFWALGSDSSSAGRPGAGHSA
jgi:cytochrome c oxidase assembly factor CtaG